MAKSHRIEIEDRDKQPNARAVIEWEIEQGNKGPRLSMTGAVSEIVDGRPSGSGAMCQQQDDIRRLFGHLPHVARLCDIWDRWHLNDLHAGCTHQRGLGWGRGKHILLATADLTPEQKSTIESKHNATQNRRQLKAAAAYLKDTDARRLAFDLAATDPHRHNPVEQSDVDDAAKLKEAALFWNVKEWKGWRSAYGQAIPSPEDQDAYGTPKNYPPPILRRFMPAVLSHIARHVCHAEPLPEWFTFEDSLLAPCPVCGYEYGSQWLYEPLPDGLAAELDALGNEAEAHNAAQTAAHPGDRPGPRTMADQLKEYGLKVSVEREPSRPDGFADGMTRHFRCIVTRKGSRARYLCHFSQGDAHTEDPTPEDVIGALVSDAYGIRDGFEGWARELGYDTDSREAERVFKACEKTAAGLRRLLSDAEVEALTYETERD